MFIYHAIIQMELDINYQINIIKIIEMIENLYDQHFIEKKMLINNSFHKLLFEAMDIIDKRLKFFINIST